MKTPMKIGLGVLGLGAVAYFLTRPKARSVGSTAQGVVASSLEPSPDMVGGGGGGASPTPQPVNPTPAVAVAQPAPPVVAEPEKLSPVKPPKTLITPTVTPETGYNGRLSPVRPMKQLLSKTVKQSASTASTDNPTFKTADPNKVRNF